MEKTGNNHSTEINIEGFKIDIGYLIKNDLMPEYFNHPLIVQWDITRKCNFKCLHCYNNSGKQLSNELTHKQKISVAKQIVEAKIYRMCISGGEPILNKSFWEIAKILKKGHVMAGTITNGWFLNYENVKLYTKYFHPIFVSIDGVKPKTHDYIRGVKGSWERAIKACKLITKNKGMLSLATTVFPLNINEIEDIIDLAYNLNALEIRFDEVRLLGRAIAHTKKLKLTEEQSLNLKKIILDKQKEYIGKLQIDILPTNLYSYSMASANIPPMFLYISPTGTCAPDSCLPFSGGSLKNKSLNEVWDKLKTIHKNKKYLKQSLSVKTGKDFIKMSKIPYLNGELHDR